MAQCNSTTITNVITCPLPFIHLIHLCHSQKHRPQQTLHVHFCQCCVSLQRLTQHFHAIIFNTVVCSHKPNTTCYHSNHFITTNATVKCQHTAQVKCCQACAAFNKVCNVLDTFTSNLITCGQSNIMPFMTSSIHDARFLLWCVETSQVKTIQLSVPHQSLAQRCHLFLVHWFVCFHMCPFITT